MSPDALGFSTIYMVGRANHRKVLASCLTVTHILNFKDAQFIRDTEAFIVKNPFGITSGSQQHKQIPLTEKFVICECQS